MTERTAHSTTQVLGLGLISAALLVVVAVILIMLGGEDIALFAVLAAVGVVVTLVVWRYDRLWARIVGLVATVVLALGAFFLAFGLFQPFSPLEFIVGLAFVLGVLLALYGGIATLVAGRRGSMGPTRGEGWIRTAVVAIMGVGVVISIAGFLATRTTVSAAEAAAATPLEMVKFEFEPETTAVSAGGSLYVTNTDAFAHDFTLEDLDIYVHIGPGSEAIVDLSTAPPGTYDYHCSLHSDGTTGMRGTLTIEG